MTSHIFKKIGFIILIVISNNLSNAQNYFGHPEGHYISPGFTFSMSLTGKPIIGGEFSYFYYFENNLLYAGTFINSTYDFKLKSLKSILGGEFGFSFIGLDIGLLLNSNKSTNRIGFIIKPQINIPFTITGFNKNTYLSFPFLSIFYGYNYVDNKYQYSELGIMFKYPIRICY